MQKKALIILAEGFEEIEAITVIDILRRGQIQLTIAGLTDTKIRGAHGVAVIADKKLDSKDTDYDACILPGGTPGSANLAASTKIRDLVTALYEKNKLIAAICAAPALVLAQTGILNNRTATCYPGMQDNFDKTTIYKEDSVVVDGNLITSRGPSTALAFALAIVEKLCDKTTSDKIKKATLLV